MPYLGGDRSLARAETEKKFAERKHKKTLSTEESVRGFADEFDFDEGEYVTYFQSLNKFRTTEELQADFAERLREEGNVNPNPRGPPILRTSSKPRLRFSAGETVASVLVKKRGLDDREYEGGEEQEAREVGKPRRI